MNTRHYSTRSESSFQPQCPNIVGYVDSFMHRGSLCIVMEYADGGDLEKIIKSRRGRLLSESNVLDWFIQLCIALKYVHNRKVLHRDLKPANIMMTAKGIVKLGDFGIAKMLDSTAALAATATGTPYYVRLMPGLGLGLGLRLGLGLGLRQDSRG